MYQEFKNIKMDEELIQCDEREEHFSPLPLGITKILCSQEQLPPTGIKNSVMARTMPCDYDATQSSASNASVMFFVCS